MRCVLGGRAGDAGWRCVLAAMRVRRLAQWRPTAGGPYICALRGSPEPVCGAWRVGHPPFADMEERAGGSSGGVGRTGRMVTVPDMTRTGRDSDGP